MRRPATRPAQTTQIVARAVQNSPEGLVARASTVSGPRRFPSTRRTSNEPLGGRVVALVLAATLPLRRSTTFQVTPLRFWSTSNSDSMRPSSGLSLIFAEELFEQVPRRSTSASFARAAAGAIAAAAVQRLRKIVVIRWWHGIARLLPFLGLSVFVLFVLTWATSAGPFLFGD